MEKGKNIQFLVMADYDGEKAMSAQPLLDAMRKCAEEDKLLCTEYRGLEFATGFTVDEVAEIEDNLSNGKDDYVMLVVGLTIIPGKNGPPVYEYSSEKTARQLLRHAKIDDAKG